MKKIIIIIILMLTTFMGENIYSNNKEKNKNEYIENIVEIVDKTPENIIITPEENKTQKINENSVIEEQTGVEKNKTIVSTPKEEKIIEQPKVQEVQKIQKVEEPIQVSQSKKEIKVVETKPESIKEPEAVIPKCSESNHYIGVGNSNKWFNSKQEAINHYQSIIKTWGDKWEKFEIDDETYQNNCPYGYETWSCPLCEKWTINFYYN